jgi:hypothetical protein
MNAAATSKDTAVITNLMKGIQIFKPGSWRSYKETIYTTCGIIKSYQCLIVQGMVNDLVQTLKKTEIFNGLDESLKNTKAGAVKQNTEINSHV